MAVEIRQIRKKDFNKILQYAGLGMGVKNYSNKPGEIKLISKYFWYMELSRATQIIGAYDGDEPVGVLMADMNGEEKAYKSFRAKIFLKLCELLMAVMFKGGASTYGEANEEMYLKFRQEYIPDGEIGFLAAEPSRNGQGIGTLLLNELAKREKGKLVYLYTDSGCTYQFYDKRGFTREFEKKIVLSLPDRKVPLRCFLYSKKL
ncbi:MAG: GNAT family N-acetyltransferase [Clostridia bacterium]|nr:GNAT family N-acetyltransferase [Clostridia bacterium]